MRRLDDDAALAEVQGYFANDHFATDACGCRVVEASHGHAVCEFDITDAHRNQMGNVMGGAIFTLADLSVAVASNVGQDPSVSVSNSIEYLSTAKGTKLISTCDADRDGRSLGYFTADVTDELGTHVARMTAVCYRMRPRG